MVFIIKASGLFLFSLKILSAIFKAKTRSSVIIAAIALSKRLSWDKVTLSILNLDKVEL